jgi:hypothetical protein
MQPAIATKLGRSTHSFFRPVLSFTQVADISLTAACARGCGAVGGGTSESTSLWQVAQSRKITSEFIASIAVWIPNGYHAIGSRSLVMPL